MNKWPVCHEPNNYLPIKKRSRQLAATIILLCIVAFLAMYIQPLSAGQAVVFSDQYSQYIVQPGDTLWSIAREYRIGRQDIRKVVWELQEVNEITPMIYPGQELWVPLK